MSDFVKRNIATLQMEIPLFSVKYTVSGESMKQDNGRGRGKKEIFSSMFS